MDAAYISERYFMKSIILKTLFSLFFPPYAFFWLYKAKGWKPFAICASLFLALFVLVTALDSFAPTREERIASEAEARGVSVAQVQAEYDERDKEQLRLKAAERFIDEQRKAYASSFCEPLKKIGYHSSLESCTHNAKKAFDLKQKGWIIIEETEIKNGELTLSFNGEPYNKEIRETVCLAEYQQVMDVIEWRKRNVTRLTDADNERFSVLMKASSDCIESEKEKRKIFELRHN